MLQRLQEPHVVCLLNPRKVLIHENTTGERNKQIKELFHK
jgi:hypothetical protein